MNKGSSAPCLFNFVHLPLIRFAGHFTDQHSHFAVLEFELTILLDMEINQYSQRNHSYAEVDLIIGNFLQSGLSIRAFARQNNIGRCTLQQWLKNPPNPLKKSSMAARKRKPDYPVVEERLQKWVHCEFENHQAVYYEDLVRESKRIASEENSSTKFKASAGWICTFGQRKEISLRCPTKYNRKVVFTEEEKVKEITFSVH